MGSFLDQIPTEVEAFLNESISKAGNNNTALVGGSTAILPLLSGSSSNAISPSLGNDTGLGSGAHLSGGDFECIRESWRFGIFACWLSPPLNEWTNERGEGLEFDRPATPLLCTYVLETGGATISGGTENSSRFS